ncbi:scavenger receptor cysteine-rich domain-containing protein DMBT1-like isoform X2 [Littorina saxatilis]|uniref:scavenger receptor cysteine-rich domain-containing protein DMBT1-like isoform X2 n=1 Tax=Littorina saxatilis TaxID=31220 RepID=UPI0038B4E45B
MWGKMAFRRTNLFVSTLVWTFLLAYLSGVAEGQDSIRLVNGSHPQEGRVEVLVNGTWGTLCDSGWSSDETEVACRQLGFNTSRFKYYRDSFFGRGLLPYNWADRYFRCRDTETALENCPMATTSSGCTRRDEGTVGISCNTTRDTDDCVSHQCQNGGYCRDQNRYYTCSCRPGFTGTRCQVDIDECASNPCQNGGTCHNHVGRFTCTCAPRFTDQFCQFRDLPGHGSVRLVNGSQPGEGLVQILANGTWGAVCGFFWGRRDAGVVCRQLGYTTLPATAYEVSVQREHVIPTIWMDHVDCRGNETRLIDCPPRLTEEHTCWTGQYAGVTCGANQDVNECASNPCQNGGTCHNHVGHFTCTCSPGFTDQLCQFRNLPGHGSVRLVNQSHAGQGIVQILANGTWGAVCGFSWDWREAAVVCRQLGHATSHSQAYTVNIAEDKVTSTIWTDDVHCRGNESRLIDCSSRLGEHHDCVRAQYAAVSCGLEYGLPKGMNTIRLVNGSHPREGRVEILINGIWGNVCDFVWSSDEAKAICRQLGYNTSNVKVYRNSFFGQGNLPYFWIDGYFQCRGSETLLENCRKVSSSICGRGARKDVGVSCNTTEDTNDCVNNACRNGATCRDQNRHYTCVCREGFTGSRCEVDINECSIQPCQNGGTCQNRLGYFTCRCPSDLTGKLCQFKNLPGHGSVRLVNGSHPGEGLVQILANGTWGAVCGYRWYSEEARVVCRQLGYNTSTVRYYDRRVPTDREMSPNWMNDVECEGDETRLADCSPGLTSKLNCRRYYDGVTCGTGQEDINECASNPCQNGGTCHDRVGQFSCTCPPGFIGQLCYFRDLPGHGSVRLVNKAHAGQGIVQILANGTWGAVCGFSWDWREAAVVCRQLGYTTATVRAYTIKIPRDQIMSKVWMDDVHCQGNETRLMDCPPTLVEQHDCWTGLYAGLSCGLAKGHTTMAAVTNSGEVDKVRETSTSDDSTNWAGVGGGIASTVIVVVVVVVVLFVLWRRGCIDGSREPVYDKPNTQAAGAVPHDYMDLRVYEAMNNDTQNTAASPVYDSLQRGSSDDTNTYTSLHVCAQDKNQGNKRNGKRKSEHVYQNIVAVEEEGHM